MRRRHPFGAAGRPSRMPNDNDVIRSRKASKSPASTRTPELLRDHVPITLIIDLLDPAGPQSRAILLAELVADDVRRDRDQLEAALPYLGHFAADQDVC